MNEKRGAANNPGEVRVLIVDDLTSMRKVLRNLLASIGFDRVTEARDASDAVLKLQAEPFDLIISDWNMRLPIATALWRRNGVECPTTWRSRLPSRSLKRSLQECVVEEAVHADR